MFCKTSVLKIFDKILEKTLVPPNCNFIKNETPLQVFFCKFSKTFENTILNEHLLTTTSVTLKFHFLKSAGSGPLFSS